MVVLKKRVPGLDEASLDRFLGRARRAVGLRGKVTVLVTTNRALRLLNQRFRDKDQPTDVLSFPAETSIALDFAGDIAISAEIAAQNARRLGHFPAEEIKILALHGILHLAGYDHERDRGEMARLEEKLRRKLRLPMALIERAAGTPRRKTAIRRIVATTRATEMSGLTPKRSNQPASSPLLAVRRPAQ